MNRRKFLGHSSLTTGGILASIPNLKFLAKDSAIDNSKLNFGIVADVHHGMIPDTHERLEQFMVEASTKDLDFIIQLGDFCHPGAKSRSFLKTWNSFNGNKYHVLGNHDMDLASKAEAMDYLGMDDNYYSFEEKGIRFIVLDANFLYEDGKFIDYNNSNFYVDQSIRTYIDDKQIEWFGAELIASQHPVIVISHQSLWHYQWGVKNRLSLQKLMEQNMEKIICCFNGHNHIDFHHIQNGIHYVEINSMSYQWIGEKYKTSRYPTSMLADYKWLDHLAPYKDPLYAFVEIDPTGALALNGRETDWVAPSPTVAGVPKQIYGSEYSTKISNYKIQFK